MSKKRKRPAQAPAEQPPTTQQPDTVAVAFIYAEEVKGGFASSLAAMMKVTPNVVSLFARQSGPRVAAARNAIVAEFLVTKHQWLFFVDSDMSFNPEALIQLLEVADPTERPIVGGLCFASQRGHVFPTIYQLDPDTDQFMAAIDYPRDQLFPVDGTGAAFILIHRSVFEQLRDARSIAPWFQEELLPDRERGEDLTFCFRARKAGFPIYVDSRVKIGHIKSFTIDEEQFEEQQRRPSSVIVAADMTPEQQRWVAEMFGFMSVPAGIEYRFNAEGKVRERSPYFLEVTRFDPPDDYQGIVATLTSDNFAELTATQLQDLGIYLGFPRDFTVCLESFQRVGPYPK